MLSTNHKTKRVLAQNYYVSNDTWTTAINNNDLVIGSSGAGKTRGYVIPNVKRCNESMIITDTKGNLHKELEPVLVREGYEVIHIDFTNPTDSRWGYNPLDFIGKDRNGRYREKDIMTVSACISPSSAGEEVFWDHSAKMIISALIGYVMECLPDEEHTLEYVLKLQNSLKDTTDELMEELYQENPDSFAARKYMSIRDVNKADKTFACIAAFVAEKLDPLTFDGIYSLYNHTHRIRFREIADKKTAVFLTVSDTDRSLDGLISVFYAQAFNELCRYAGELPYEQYKGTLPLPVRFYLDDFATNCKIENFDNMISVIRSRGISVSIILQSITQLEALYGPYKAKTIVNGCDHILYLGGQDMETARLISQRANKSVSTILDMPTSKGYILERGTPAKYINLYRHTDMESEESKMISVEEEISNEEIF